MDGLPAMHRGLAVGKELDITPLKKMVGPLAPKANGATTSIDGFSLEQLIVVFIAAFIAGLMIMFAIYPSMTNFLGALPRGQKEASWISRSPR